MTAFFSSQFQEIGQQVDISIMEALLDDIDRRAINLVGHAYNPTEVSLRISPKIQTSFPLGNFPCKNGYFSISGGARHGFWPRVVAMLDMPELLEDPRFCTGEAQAQPSNYEAFLKIFLPWCLEHTQEEIVRLGQTNRALVAPIENAKDLVNDPHLKARDSFVEVDHPITGKVKYPGAPFRATEAPFQIKKPAPLLGQHNAEVYGQLGYTEEDLVKLMERSVI